MAPNPIILRYHFGNFVHSQFGGGAQKRASEREGVSERQHRYRSLYKSLELTCQTKFIRITQWMKI